MRRNVGSLDRAIRIILGIVLFSMVFVGPQTAWGYLGLLPLVTGFLGWCPLYSLLRVSTARPQATQ
jgi:hypothetical protein